MAIGKTLHGPRRPRASDGFAKVFVVRGLTKKGSGHGVCGNSPRKEVRNLMRRIKSFRALLPILSLLLLLVGVPAAPANASVSVSISSFHESLSPYGRWVYVEDYGDVWCPSSVSAGWQPYEDGEWVWTDYGWTSVSY